MKTINDIKKQSAYVSNPDKLTDRVTKTYVATSKRMLLSLALFATVITGTVEAQLVPQSICVEVPNSTANAYRTRYSTRSDCNLEDVKLETWISASASAYGFVADQCEAQITQAEANNICQAEGWVAASTVVPRGGIWFNSLELPNTQPIRSNGGAGEDGCVVIRDRTDLSSLQATETDYTCGPWNGWTRKIYRGYATARCGVQCINQ
jgi:hypothetical protein